VRPPGSTLSQPTSKRTPTAYRKSWKKSSLTANLDHEQALLAEAQRNYEDAQHNLDDARAEQDRVRTARLALCWIPMVAVALTVVDITKEENDVKSADSVVNAEKEQLNKDSQLLQSHAAQLGELRNEGIVLHTLSTSLQTSESQLQSQQTKLNEESAYLGPLKVNIDHCIHAVSGALGSAANIDNMMSMKNVGEGIRGLVSALKTDSGFSGALATLNDQGFAELDQRIQAMQKSSKRMANLAV